MRDEADKMNLEVDSLSVTAVLLYAIFFCSQKCLLCFHLTKKSLLFLVEDNFVRSLVIEE